MNAQEALRVEQVLEGVESLARAAAAKDLRVFRTDGDREIAAAAYSLAREELGAALHAFLAPVTRVVEGGVSGQPQQAQGDDRIVCGKCGQDSRCALACPDWHDAIRSKVDTADETFPICTVCDMPSDPSIMCCEKSCPRRADHKDNLA